MGASEWIAFGGLLFTIASGGLGVVVVLFNNKAAILEQMRLNKEDLDQELNAIRMSAYEEYKTLREEIQNVKDLARKEFGETIRSIREKINEVELWARDAMKKDYHSLNERIDNARDEALRKVENLENRTRQLEMFNAKEMGRREGARSSD